MAKPSSQAISVWVLEAVGSDWTRLDELCLRVLRVRLGGAPESVLTDLIAENIAYVAEHLRDEIGSCALDGVEPEIEVDHEQTPYVRRTDASFRTLLAKLRRIDPFDFERVCAAILSKLGAQAEVTKKSNDDGVDFYAIDFDFVPDGISTPQACRAVVIGQAKRFGEGNYVKETDVRAFVGGAIKVKNDLATMRKIYPLSPVVFAYWTTSEFNSSAKQYARDLGIWYMNGRALAKYVAELGLEVEVDSLLENPRGDGHA